MLLVVFAGAVACKKATPPTSGTAMTANSPVTSAAASPLTVLSITGGDVFVMKPGEQEWQRGEKGMTLGSDYKIKTETSGKASITFFEGSVIDLEGDTEISLADLSLAGTTTTIKLTQTIGETVSRVKKLADTASSYEIETPAAVMAVRGTTVYTGVAENGTAFFGSIDGTFTVTSQGKQTQVTEGNHVTVTPGEPPGEPESGNIPTPTPTTAPPTTIPPTTTSPAVVSINSGLSESTIFCGETVTINYSVSNGGAVAVSGIAVNNNEAGIAAYVNGDSDNDSVLDPGEDWMFKADYTVPAGASGTLSTTTTVSGQDTENRPVSASVVTLIPITALTIQIISPNANTVVSEVIQLVGSVNDPAVSDVTVTVNGNPVSVTVSGGHFSANITLASGSNTISITAKNPGGATARTTLVLEPVEAGGK